MLLSITLTGELEYKVMLYFWNMFLGAWWIPKFVNTVVGYTILTQDSVEFKFLRVTEFVRMNGRV